MCRREWRGCLAALGFQPGPLASPNRPMVSAKGEFKKLHPQILLDGMGLVGSREAPWEMAADRGDSSFSSGCSGEMSCGRRSPPRGGRGIPASCRGCLRVLGQGCWGWGWHSEGPEVGCAHWGGKGGLRGREDPWRGAQGSPGDASEGSKAPGERQQGCVSLPPQAPQKAHSAPPPGDSRGTEAWAGQQAVRGARGSRPPGGRAGQARRV